MELLGALNSVTMMSSAYIQLQTLSVSRYWVDDVVFTTADPHSATYAYNDANEMTSMTEDGVTTSFTYDDWGRLSTKTQGSYEAEYFYRYGDKLKMVTSTFPGEAALVEYMYDGLGKRRFKVVNSSEWSWYRWDLGWNVLAEYADYPGTTTIWDVGALERTYTHTPGGSVSRILADVGGTAPATGNYQYYFHDHLGSTRALHHQSKAVIASNEHTPYGEVYAASGVTMPHTFTGKSYDAEDGLYFFPYRYYSPGMGRWTTRDPLGMVDGPNVYGYVGGSPTRNTDRLGLRKWTWPLGGRCCNYSKKPVYILDEADWVLLKPGECHNGDCDGMCCGDKFYDPGPITEYTCKDDGCYEDDPIWDDKVDESDTVPDWKKDGCPKV
ncbi:MAG: RHS repeat-associated core domain-containing protein [Candidatus Hydrogenedentes bacterium]|nr:RHS repeat-associated core domain-containing protein [Candidatus Hydrogenedentota bacterium]